MTQHNQHRTCPLQPLHSGFFVGSSGTGQVRVPRKEEKSWKPIHLFYSTLGQGHVFGRDKTDTRTLGIIQLMILNRIKANPENATARKITDDLSKIFGERIPDAQVFVTLSRLRDRGLVNAVTPKLSDSKRANPNSTGKEWTTIDTTALPLKPSAKPRGRRAATMKLTPEGVAAVKQAALLLSGSAGKSLKGDSHETTTTDASTTSTVG